MVESFGGEKTQINEFAKFFSSCTAKHYFLGLPTTHFLASLPVPICGSKRTQELAKSFQQ